MLTRNVAMALGGVSLEELVYGYDLGTPMGISPCIFEVSMSGKRGGREGKMVRKSGKTKGRIAMYQNFEYSRPRELAWRKIFDRRLRERSLNG